MMNKWMIGFLVALLSFYLIMVFVVDYGSDKDSSNIQNKVEELETKSKELTEQNKMLDLKIENLEETTDSLSESIAIVELEQSQLKEKRDEKISSVDGMDNNELFSFFANFKTQPNTD